MKKLLAVVLCVSVNSWAAPVAVRRGAKFTEYTDSAKPGVKTFVATVHDQNYLDENGVWQTESEDFEDDGADGFAFKIQKMRHRIRVMNDGTRRWYPRRNILGEYVEFGRPQYWTGSTWANVTLGTPTRSGNIITFTRPNYSLILTATWQHVKFDLVLNNSSVPTRYRFPVSLSGLTFSNFELTSVESGEVVGTVDRPTAADANGVDLPMTNSISGGYVIMEVNTTGATFPVTIDPTFTAQPAEAAAKDTMLVYNDDADRSTGIVLTVGHYSAGGYWNNSMIQFDVSSLAGTTVTGASLLLTSYNTRSATMAIRAYPILSANSAWAETCTWKHKDTAFGSTYWAGDSGNNGGNDGGCDVSGTDHGATESGSFIYTSGTAANTQFTMTLNASDVQNWVNGLNFGLVIKDTDTANFLQFHSANSSTAGYRPQLSVDYTAATSAPTMQGSFTLQGTATFK